MDDSFEMMIGGFWRPGQEDKKFTGTLVARKGLVEIYTAPDYADRDDFDFRASIEEINNLTEFSQVDAICGFTTDNKCTLLNSLIMDGGGLTDFPSKQKVSQNRYRAIRTVMGLHLESSEAMSIDGAAFYLTKIHRLMPTPWRSRFEKDNTTTHVVPWKGTEIFRFVSDELRAEIVCEVSAKGAGMNRKGVRIRAVPRIKITPRSPQSVDWFISIAIRIENFFTLFLGTSVNLKHVQLFQGEKDIGWIVQKMRRRKEKVNLQTWIGCSFQDVARALGKWFAVPRDQQLVELTLLGVMRKSNMFDETGFLTLAQTLEGFGRIRFGGHRPRQAKFDQLIRKTYDLLSRDFALKIVGERSEFVRKIIETRDYYTHLGNPRGPSAPKTPKELFLLNKRLDAFLRCAMLIDLGILESFLWEPILYQATRWR